MSEKKRFYSVTTDQKDTSSDVVALIWGVHENTGELKRKS